MTTADRTSEDTREAVSSRVLAKAAPEHWAPSFFGVVPKDGVRRRPSDLVHLVLALAAIVVCVVVTDGFTAREDGAYRWISDLPEWIDTVGTWLFLSCTVGAVVVVIGALLLTRNFRLSLTLVAIGVVTALVAFALAWLIDVDALLAAAGQHVGSLAAESVVWLTVTTAVLLTAVPYLVRPARRTVHLVHCLAVLGGVLAGIGPPGTVVAAVGVGWAITSVVGLVIGTPAATPTTKSVVDALGQLGIRIGDLKLGGDQTWGETRFVGRTSDGRPATLVVIGRDGADARFLGKAWRSAFYRDAGPSISVSRSAQLEHRAYMHLMAAKAGVPVSEVVIAASGGREDAALLALIDPEGQTLSELGAEALTDDVLDGAWASLDRLHAARLAHGDVGPEHLLVEPDGSVALLDFAQASAGGPPGRARLDQVDLLVSTAGLVGDDRALAVAMRAIGADGLTELLPMVTTAALSKGARRAIEDPRKRLKAVREAAAALSGTEVPTLIKLHRVSLSSVFMAAATFLGFYLIVAQFAGVDLAATLSDAQWPWVALAALLSFVPQFSGSIALMGTVSQPLPFRPVLAEQFANNFTGLIGGTVANTALVIRFFQKQGLEVAVAASSGVMNSLAGGIIQVILVTLGLLLSNTDYVPSSVGGGSIEQIVLIAVIAIGFTVSVALLVPKLRSAIRQRVAPQWEAAKENLGSILRTPHKAVMIFGGNICSQLAFALVLEAALHAYGASLPIADMILINCLASLVGGAAPVPGGMGVIEAGLIAGMTAAGVPQSEAVAATFTARLFTTYLSPIWGWAALQWLRRGDYV